MLIPFALDEISLQESPAAYYDASEWNIFHKNVMKFYKDCGALCYSGDAWNEARTELFLSKIPNNYRQYWSVLLQAYPRLRPKFNWDGIIPSKSEEVFNTIEIGLMSNQRGNNCFGFSEESLESERKITSHSGAKLTLVKGAAYHATERYEEFQNLAGKKIFLSSAKDVSIEEEWRLKFKNLVCFENSPRFITIFDRFGFQEELINPRNNRHHSTSTFIQRVDRDACENKIIQIISSDEILPIRSSRPHPINSEQKELINSELRNLKALCRGGKIAKIELIVVSSSKARWEGHDRHVRFGNLYVWDLGSGTDIFEVLSRRKNVSVSFKTQKEVVESYAATEREFINQKDSVLFRTFV